MFNPQLSILLLLGLGAASGVATAFFWWLWYLDPKRPRSWLLRTLARAVTACTIGSWYLGWIAYIRITEGLSGVPEWTAPITQGVSYMFAGLTVYLAVSFWRNSGYRPRR